MRILFVAVLVCVHLGTEAFAEPDANTQYKAAIGQHILKFRSFPSEAKMRREHGTAIVRFQLDSKGAIVASSLKESSGSDTLDKEALASVLRAQPYPAAPPGIGQERLNFTVPFVFRLKESDSSSPAPAPIERGAQSTPTSRRSAIYEAMLSPQCKQNTCFHELLRNIEPILILKDGTLRRFESSSIEKQCGVDEDIGQADCYKRPASNEFGKFASNFAHCSPSNPIIVATVYDTPNSKSYVATFLTFGDNMRTYQVAASVEYLVVCHGWEPQRFDESFVRYITALGYNPAYNAPPQKRFISEAEVLSFFQDQDENASLPTTASVQALEGKWYSGNVAVCQGRPGETEGLLTFKNAHFVGYENDCKIQSSKADGRFLALKMVCSGEGMQSKETEIIEFLSGSKIRRIVADGRKRYTFTHIRCP